MPIYYSKTLTLFLEDNFPSKDVVRELLTKKKLKRSIINNVETYEVQLITFNPSSFRLVNQVLNIVVGP